jgi:acetylglutamate kinase
VQGRRYTDPATLEIVVRVLIDEINASIVAQIRELGGRAVGLHRHPLPVLFGERITLPGDTGPIDLGLVGTVTRSDHRLIEDFCAGGVVPVIPSVALDDNGGWLNVNADTAAAAVAAHVGAEKVVFLSDTPGILRDRSDPYSLIPSIDADGCNSLIREGVIDSGMLPKVEACLDALRGGVKKTHMIDGRIPHSLLLEIYTDRGIGTEIVLEGRT